MKIEFYSKETGENLLHQNDFRVDSDGCVWGRDWNCSFHRITYVYANNIEWRIVNE
jgi:hypothetical protein